MPTQTMKQVSRPRYAARLNAFKPLVSARAPNALAELIAIAGGIDGITSADLNYPDHCEQLSPVHLTALLLDNGLELNGLAMRYYGRRDFAAGAFTNPDPAIRREAIDLTRRGIDALAGMGASLMTLWLGQDGFDYSFQADYRRLWDDTISAVAEVADHNPDIDISIEYKPAEPRAHALIPDAATALLAVTETGRRNVGVTLDFAHALMAGEMPAHSARLIDRHSRLMGVHLNDGNGMRDDGLMVGSVHPVQTLELFVELARIGYCGVIYFDTFPDHSGLDPVRESGTNVAVANQLHEIATGLVDDPSLASAMENQDATASMQEVFAALSRIQPRDR